MILILLLARARAVERYLGVASERSGVGIQGNDPAAVVDLDLAARRTHNACALAVVDSEPVEFILHKPPVTVSAYCDADDVSRVAAYPGATTTFVDF